RARRLTRQSAAKLNRTSSRKRAGTHRPSGGAVVWPRVALLGRVGAGGEGAAIALRMTWKEPVAVCPTASVAVHVTVVRPTATVLFGPPLSANPAGTRMSPRVFPAGTPMTLVVTVPNPNVASGPGPLLPAARRFTKVTVAPRAKMPPFKFPLMVALVTVRA